MSYKNDLDRVLTVNVIWLKGMCKLPLPSWWRGFDSLHPLQEISSNWSQGPAVGGVKVTLKRDKFDPCRAFSTTVPRFRGIPSPAPAC